MGRAQLKTEVLIVGGGIHGLATAYALRQRGIRDIRLLEQHHCGHPAGSSHGHSRVIRSAYSDPAYVEAMKATRQDAWPRWIESFGQKHPLLIERPACVFGPSNGPMADYASAVTTQDCDISPLTLAQAEKRFPRLRFSSNDIVLDDRSAGLLAAKHTLQGLLQWLRRKDIKIHEGVVVQSIESSANTLQVRTSQGYWQANYVVVTAGPWTFKLLPSLRSLLRVRRQTVAYFDLAPQAAHDATQLPIWACIAAGHNAFHYGLPAFGRPGIKVAQHELLGAHDDPHEVVAISQEQRAHLRQVLSQVLQLPIGPHLHSEHCLYTCTNNEDFILDHHPQHPRIVFGAGFSGHSFKFAPVVGEALASLVLDGHYSDNPLATLAPRFTVEAHRKAVESADSVL